MRNVKESDILVLSTEALHNSHGHPVNDIKKNLTPKWLKSILLKPSVMLAYVSDKAKKGSSFIEVKLDSSKAHFLRTATAAQTNQAGKPSPYLPLHVYLLDSLATTIREYKTLRMSEFYPLSETILNPQSALSHLHKESTAEMRHKCYPKMEKYLKEQGESFNKSQREALIEVAKMKSE